MKIQVAFEIKVTQADIASYHEVSPSKAKVAMEDFDEESAHEFLLAEFEEPIRDALLEEFGNYLEE